jgi:hypothetical protein
MLKPFLMNSIIKEMKVIRRLGSKITNEQAMYTPKEGMRNLMEVLQYLSVCGTNTICYWYRNNKEIDFKSFVSSIKAQAQSVTPQNFVATMDAQIALVTALFEKITEEELWNKEVDYPWGDTATLGVAIMETSIKWLTGYKMQLFLTMKLSSDQVLTTPDLWRKTELETP